MDYAPMLTDAQPADQAYDEGLLSASPAGWRCEAGGFHIDPWQPVDTAVVTHAHRDHACPGSTRYLTSREGEPLLRMRLGPEPRIESLDYGETRTLGDVLVSLHPSGHIRGSAQVRLERQGQVAVVSGDYKRAADPTCAAFQPLRCDTFVTESTFGLPIYRWPDPAAVIEEIEAWWRGNQRSGKASLLYAYALGKAQRLLASLDASIGPMFTHGAVEQACAVYRAAGVALPETRLAVRADRRTDWSQALILAPPSAHGTPWSRRFRRTSTAMASGWMRVRGIRRRRSLDRGFVFSDHAGWPELLQTIQETGARRVWTVHGHSEPLARYLREDGLDARSLETPNRRTAEDPDGAAGGEVGS